MSFYATEFVFDNVPCEKYNLFLANFDSGVIENNFGGDIEIIEEKTRNKNYFYGVKQSGNLTFPITMMSEAPLDYYDVSAIGQLLFNRLEYKYLQIVQPDLEGVFFRCMLINPKKISIGNQVYGFKCDVYCSEGHVWSDEFTYQYNIITPNQSIVFINLSDIEGYIYPKINFTTSSTTTSFSIKNINDNDRVFSFTGINSSENLIIDNELKIITSSTGQNRLQKFNLNWFRTVSGNNNLVINGNGTLKIICRFLKKI